MGIDTNVKIIGKLDVDQLVTFIKEEISESITTSIEEEEQFFDTRSDIVFLGIDGIEKRDVGWIHISYNGKNRSIFYLYKDTFWFSPQDIASNIKNGTPELNGEYTYLKTLKYQGLLLIIINVKINFTTKYLISKKGEKYGNFFSNS